MVEGSTRSREATRWQWVDALLRWWCWLTFVLQCQHQDAFESAHVDQLEAECPGARGIETLRGVALRQPQ